MKMATKSQITKIHVLLIKFELYKDKRAIIINATNGRTASSKELTIVEAKNLIQLLCNCDPAEKLKSCITQLAFQVGISYGSSELDNVLNRVKLDMFLNHKGAVKKDLQKQTYSELVKTHRQFEAILQGMTKMKDLRSADKLVSDLLNELDLTLIK